MVGPGDPPLGGAQPSEPHARVDLPALASRPIYPFPTITRYAGRGDPTAAGSYEPGLGSTANAGPTPSTRLGRS